MWGRQWRKGMVRKGSQRRKIWLSVLVGLLLALKSHTQKVRERAWWRKEERECVCTIQEYLSFLFPFCIVSCGSQQLPQVGPTPLGKRALKPGLSLLSRRKTNSRLQVLRYVLDAILSLLQHYYKCKPPLRAREWATSNASLCREWQVWRWKKWTCRVNQECQSNG